MNILLTSAGRRTYLVDYFKEALAGKGKVHAANSKFSPALNRADEWVLTPLIYDNGYIEFLLDYVKKFNIRMIVSLFDIDLPVLAKSKFKFEELGVEVVISSPEVITICNDKWLTYTFLNGNDFITPKTFIDLRSVKEALANNLIDFPLIIKPRWGMGSIGIYKADSIQELDILYLKVQREINNSYLKYESNVDLNNAVIIQEYINEDEYGLDVFNDLKGNYVQTFVKKKLAMRSGETDGAKTQNNSRLLELGKKLAHSLKHIGNLDLDCFLGKDELYVLELNCRFGGGYPFSHLAGANIPKVLIDLVEGRQPEKEDLTITYGLEMAKDITPFILR